MDPTAKCINDRRRRRRNPRTRWELLPKSVTFILRRRRAAGGHVRNICIYSGIVVIIIVFAIVVDETLSLHWLGFFFLFYWNRSSCIAKYSCGGANVSSKFQRWWNFPLPDMTGRTAQASTLITRCDIQGDKCSSFCKQVGCWIAGYTGRTTQEGNAQKSCKERQITLNTHTQNEMCVSYQGL